MKNIHLYIVIGSLLFWPDFLLSLSGRDTFLLHRSNMLFTIAQIWLLFAILAILYEIVCIVLERNWSTLLAYFIAILVIVVVSNISLNYFTNKSIREATIIINSFVRGENNSDLRTIIDDEIRDGYANLLTQKFNHLAIDFTWSSPSKRRYDFTVSKRTQPPLILTLYTYQEEPPTIWIHNHK